jgi:hypothetical protein
VAFLAWRAPVPRTSLLLLLPILFFLVMSVIRQEPLTSLINVVSIVPAAFEPCGGADGTAAPGYLVNALRLVRCYVRPFVAFDLP